jgi:hypothetical protein
MSTIDGLLRAYANTIALPWQGSLSGSERVWMAVYDPPQERRLRFRLEEFRIATQAAGHGWQSVDLTDLFARWMAEHPYREEYFAEPELMESALPEFVEYVVGRVRDALQGPEIDDNTVVALYGVASLFGLMRASALLERVAPLVKGRLLLFFPGQRDGNNYRMLDAHDGWSYLAVPITATE